MTQKTTSPNPRVLEIIRLRDEEEKSWAEIAVLDDRGVKPRTVQAYYDKGLRKLVQKPKHPKKHEIPAETAARVLEVVGDPSYEQRLTDLARDCGLPKSTMAGLIKRLKTRHLPVVEELKKVTTKEFRELIDDRLRLALDYLDPYVMAAASAKDIAIIVGIMVEKRQLLAGEPTAILSVEDRRSLNELAAVIHKEIKRREMVIDVTPVHIDEPPTPSDLLPSRRDSVPPPKNVDG